MPAYHLGSTVEVSGTTISMSANISEGDFSVPGAYRAAAVATAPAPGTYQLDMQAQSQMNSYARRTIGSVIVGAPTPAASPQYRALSGHWLAFDESGWGVTVTQGDSGALFAVWYTYRPTEPQSGTFDAREEGLWLVMSNGRWISPTEFRGILYEARGTPSHLPFESSRTQLFPAGVATLRVLSTERMEFQAEAGVGLAPEMNKRKTLQRLIF
jgi:hypothetical protein